MHRLSHKLFAWIVICTTLGLIVMSCSKSPVGSASDAVSSAAVKMLAPLNPADASRQADNMIRLFEDRPECAIYKSRMRDAGSGPPAAGATQIRIIEVYEAAKKAGCRKAE